MGIQINGQTDIISATDGALNVSGADLGSASASSLNISGIVTASGFSGNLTGSINSSGVSTFSGGLLVGTGASISSPATNVLTLGTNNTESVRINSSGHFIMPAGSFDLMVGDSTNSNAGTQTISVGSTASGSSGGIQLWANPTNGNSWIQFGDNSASASQYRGWVNYQHADDNLNFGTAGTERLRIDSSGRVTTPYQPRFFAKCNTSSYSTTSPIQFTSVDVNIGSGYDNSTYRFTAPIAGTYYFVSTAYINAGNTVNDGGYIRFRINGNGAQYAYAGSGSSTSPNGHITVTLTKIITLSANDWVDVTFISYVNGSYYAGPSETTFGGYLMG